MGLRPPKSVTVEAIAGERHVLVSGETNADRYWASASTSAVRPVPDGEWFEAIAATKGTRLPDGRIDLGPLKGLKPDVSYAVCVGCKDKQGNRERVSGKSATVEVPPMIIKVRKNPPVITPTPVDPPPPETPYTSITSLAQVTTPNTLYRWTGGDLTLASTYYVTVPGVTIDFGTAHIRYAPAALWATMLWVKANGVTITGGHWHANVLQKPFGVESTATGATFDGLILEPIRDGAGVIVPPIPRYDPVTGAFKRYDESQPYGFIELYGSFDTTIKNCVASAPGNVPTYAKYAVYSSGATNLTLLNNTFAGSQFETPARFHDQRGTLTIRGNHLTCGGKGSGLRIHDGPANIVVDDNDIIGDTLFGPLGEGDGGQAWSVNRWLNAAGNEVPYALRDEARTFVERVTKLGLRLSGTVTATNNRLKGYLQTRAGVVQRIQISGGTMEPRVLGPTDITGQPIGGPKNVYPEPAYLLPDDIPRPKTYADFANVAFSGTAPAIYLPTGWTATNCPYTRLTV